MSDYQFANPLVIRNDGAIYLKRIELFSKSYNESWLQALLFKHPNLIPFNKIEPVFSDSIPIAREVPTNSGPMDLLYINAKGFLTIVETKLWRNPEARRTVVAQVIDYAKDMAQWSYDDLIYSLKKAGLDGGDDPLVKMFEEFEGIEFDVAQFIDNIVRNIQLCRFLLLIVGDGIQEGVEHMTSFLQKTPQLGYTLGLVEIGLYHDGSENGDIYVQPNVLARTKEISRAIVEIKAPIKPSEIKITIPQEEFEGKAKRKNITEDEYFEELTNSTNTNVVEFVRSVLRESEDHDLQIEWAGAGPLLKYNSPSVNTFFTFCQLHRDGSYAETARFYRRFVKLGLTLDICRKHFEEIVDLVPGASIKLSKAKDSGIKREQLCYGQDPKITDRIPLEKIQPCKEEWFKSIDNAIWGIKRLVGDD